MCFFFVFCCFFLGGGGGAGGGGGGGGGGGVELLLFVPGNSYGHVGMVSSHNHTFFLGKLEKAVNQYFVHILLLVTDNNPS